MEPLTDEYIALVKRILIVTSEASEELLREAYALTSSPDRGWMATPGNSPEREAALDKRRAEIWARHLHAAGLTIGTAEKG